jgi:hypothetical protein
MPSPIEPPSAYFYRCREGRAAVAYAALACLESSLALAFLRTRSLWSARSDTPQSDGAFATARTAGSATASVLLFYFYGGLETGTGLWQPVCRPTRDTPPQLLPAPALRYSGLR